MSKAPDNTEKKLGFLFITFCQENDVEKVNCCIKLGVNVNTVSEDGEWSGLTIAAHKNYSELLDLLLSQPGIDVNLTPRNWMTRTRTPLMIACEAGHHGIVRRLLQVPGINITHKNSTGHTALHMAAINGRSACLEELAKVPGLDWNCKSNEGWTPLHTALYDGYPDCVRIIVSQPGVDFTVKTDIGT